MIHFRSGKDAGDMGRQGCQSRIRDVINEADDGSVFVAADFADLGEKKNVNMALIRLAERGLIRNVMFGVYYKPGSDGTSRNGSVPFPDDVAHAIARSLGWTIVPCGDAALNILGLSSEVPSRWVYVCDGAYREYTYGGTAISFKKTANKEISNLSFKTALTVQALKSLGKENITDDVVNKLRRILTAEEKRKMISEAKSVTSWVYEAIKATCKSKDISDNVNDVRYGIVKMHARFKIGDRTLPGMRNDIPPGPFRPVQSGRCGQADTAFHVSRMRYGTS